MTPFRYILIIVTSIALSSCYYDEPPAPASLDPEKVSFSTHVIPILNTNCNYSGCHNQGGIPPDLSVENAYTNLFNGYVNTTIAEESILFQRIDGRSGSIMPPQGKMSPQEVEIILAWIEKGALND